jgi:hypothetical protein
MSVFARSRRSAGRPVLGRPAYAVVVALTAAFAVGAPAAVAGVSPDPADPVVAEVPEAPVVETPPVEEPPAAEDPPVTEPPAEEPPAVEQPPAVEESPMAEGPPAAESPAADSPATGSPTAEPPATDRPTLPTAVKPVPPPRADPLSPPATPRSVAQNVSTVIQAVWQVQQGCRTYCYGTSQSQQSVQSSETSQSATAVSEGDSTAEARNEATTIQFVWQMQIGCVAFCFQTSQSQDAAQDARTTQAADAQSALMSWADNLAQTVQYVFQTQRGCERECHGVSQSQTASQQQSTSQTSTATSNGDGGWPMLPDWLVAFAQNIGATIQTSYQYQEALCLEHCTGDVQVQEAIQRAGTDQRAVAMAPPPPAPAEPPPAGEPPSGEPPMEPGTAPVTEVVAEPAAAGPFAVVAGRAPVMLKRKGLQVSRRQEIVLRTRTVARDAATSPAGGGLVAATAGTSRTATASQLAQAERSGRSETVADRAGDQLPSTTFVVPAGDSGGSSIWLLIALLAAPIAGLAGLLGTRLASNLTRI